MEMDLIRADGAQPSLHLDQYVRARTIYIYGLVALLDRIKLLEKHSISTGYEPGYRYHIKSYSYDL